MTHAIVDGLDLAIRDSCFVDGKPSQTKWIRKKSTLDKMNSLIDYAFTGNINHDVDPVEAFIGTGKWSAACPVCGPNATEYVNPVENVFYCFNCGNRALLGDARFVVFPPADKRHMIEMLLLERPMDDRRGANLLARVTQAQVIIPHMGREWGPAETIEMVQGQNNRIKGTMRNQVKVKKGKRPTVVQAAEEFKKKQTGLDRHDHPHEKKRNK